MIASKWPVLVLGLAGLAACRGTPPPVPPAGHAAALPDLPPPPAPAARRYSIDTAGSELRLLVYRAGPMASLGHNHVIVSRSLHGSVTVYDSGAVGSFHVSFAPAEFLVDLPEDRARAGADFSTEVGGDARSGTLRNLLSEGQLNGAQYPRIDVDSAAVTGTGTNLAATVIVTVAGRRAEVTAPFTLERGPARLHAVAAFTLRQTALGITPFSVMRGALRVEDEMRVSLELEALADPDQP